MLTRRLFLTSFASALAVLKGIWPARGKEVAATRVTFVLFNDFYLMNEKRTADGKLRGGFARLATIIKDERAKHRHVVVAHGGDTLSPSLMSGFDQGRHIVALTNRIAPDIFVAGNHEFDFGRDVFFERMAEAKFPLFGANLRRADGSAVPGHQDRSIREFDGVKIGITGIAYENSARLSSPEDLKFLPAVRTTREQSAQLRREGADFVCAVLHCDRGDAFLLQFSRIAELVLTGHTHDLFINYDDETAIVESSFDAHFVTAIDVEIAVTEENGRRTTRWSPRFRVIDSADVTPDAEMVAAVAAFDEDFSREAGTTIAVTAVELDSRNATVRAREAAIGNLFADAMRLSMRADAAIINGGGIRAGRVYAPGTPLSRRDILAELPFNNRVVAVEIAGRDLLRAIENGIAQLPVAAGRFPQVSGMRIVFDPAQKPRERVVSIEVAGAPLDPDRRYRVAILDFLARGGDDYTMFREATRITPDADSPLLANEIMAYLRERKTVSPQVEGRLVAR